MSLEGNEASFYLFDSMNGYVSLMRTISYLKACSSCTCQQSQAERESFGVSSRFLCVFLFAPTTIF